MAGPDGGESLPCGKMKGKPGGLRKHEQASDGISGSAGCREGEDLQAGSRTLGLQMWALSASA